MCTGFVKQGRDLIAGFNFDLAVGVWDYAVYAKKDLFYIGIRVGGTVYKTHGVNRNGNFGNLPYMNAPELGVYRRGKDCQRIDLLVGDYIAGKYSYADVLELAEKKSIVNIPGASMHTLLCDGSGSICVIEPGLGCREIRAPYAAISNFPLLDTPADLSPVWYGKDRCDRANEILASSGDGFSAADGLALLKQTKQDGEWATRVSFVYSHNENAVYYVTDNDFSNVTRHAFA